MRGWQANSKRTCASPVILGLCPKLKYPPLCGGIIICLEAVALAPDGLDVVLPGAQGVQLLAHPRHADLDVVQPLVDGSTPDLVGELGIGEHLTGMLG